MKNIIVISAVLLVMAVNCSASELKTDPNLIDLFDTQDGFAQVIAFKKFEKSTLVSERATKLVELWTKKTNKKQQTNVRFSILAYLMQGDNRQLLDDVNLSSQVNQLIQSENSNFRRGLLNLHAKRSTADSKQIVLDFLNDKDEFIQHGAMVSLVKQSGVDKSAVEEALKRYIKSKKADKHHQKSIKKAQTIIENIKKEKAGNN